MNIPADSEVSRKIENLYNRFKVMLIKRDEASKNRVTAILKSIDEELAKKKTRFLTGDGDFAWCSFHISNSLTWLMMVTPCCVTNIFTNQ